MSILVYCDAPSHPDKRPGVESFHHVADGHWVADARRGKGGPAARRVDHYAGPTTLAYRAGHRKAVLVCPLCSDDLKLNMTTLEPIFNRLAEVGESRISVSMLRRLCC